MRAILVTGALGQIGSELVPALRRRYGEALVIASDRRQSSIESTPIDFETIDCGNAAEVAEVVHRRGIGTIYHLAAMLSAVAEERPQEAWNLNLGCLYNVLEVARQTGCSVFFPSSIAAFGPTTPRDRTPQITIQRPTSIYGVTKVAGELLADYYFTRFSIDTRGLRLPGLISASAPPGGGTTDYAVEMFDAALAGRRYLCSLAPETRLDMMFMDDAIAAMIQLMEAPPARLRHRNAYNVTAMSFTPSELAEAIRCHVPGFAVDYQVDMRRQAIADSWPRRLDDSAARRDWDWSPRFDLAATVDEMLKRLGARRSVKSGTL